MLKNALVLILGIFILSACTNNPGGYFKRSANNKLFDRKGFQGGKRSPLYNRKYIEKAKRNVAASNFDDEFDEEGDYLESEYGHLGAENAGLINREMYRQMIEEDIEHNGSKKYSRRASAKDLEYPSISKANSGFYEDRNEGAELKKELDEIKSMLNEAKLEMASRKCPTAAEIEKQRSASQQNTNMQKANNVNNVNTNKKISPKENTNSTIIEPVKSI